MLEGAAVWVINLPRSVRLAFTYPRPMPVKVLRILHNSLRFDPKLINFTVLLTKKNARFLYRIYIIFFYPIQSFYFPHIYAGRGGYIFTPGDFGCPLLDRIPALGWTGAGVEDPHNQEVHKSVQFTHSDTFPVPYLIMLSRAALSRRALALRKSSAFAPRFASTKVL